MIHLETFIYPLSLLLKSPLRMALAELPGGGVGVGVGQHGLG